MHDADLRAMIPVMTSLPTLSLIAIIMAAGITAILTFVLRPVLQRYALAKPNARSSHVIPTPQGGGIAVIVSVVAVAGALISFSLGHPVPMILFAATIIVAAVGAVDDIRSISVLPRLLLQAGCASAALYAVGGQLPLLPLLPLWIEKTLLFFALLWFINLVNFMDGLDLMTVVEVVPVTLGLVALGWLGLLTSPLALIAAALAGAMIGFAPFNKPVAKVFLGDVGSLPIGLLLGWCLIELAVQQSLVAALLLPLYYLADATITLFRRLALREPVWVAHRSHFYQQATTNGFGVPEIVGRVFLLNFLLMGLGIAAALTDALATQLGLLVAGGAAVALVLRQFASPRSVTPAI